MSTTGIDRLKNRNTKDALIFYDDTCPYCGNNLQIETIYVDSKTKINIRYYCSECGFICPIKYDKEKTTPIYDDTIYNFINDFGKIDRYKFIKRWEKIENERRNDSERVALQNKTRKR